MNFTLYFVFLLVFSLYFFFQNKKLGQITSRYRILCDFFQIEFLPFLPPKYRLPHILLAPHCSGCFYTYNLWWPLLLVTNSQSSSTSGHLGGSPFPMPERHAWPHDLQPCGQRNKSRSDEGHFQVELFRLMCVPLHVFCPVDVTTKQQSFCQPGS